MQKNKNKRSKKKKVAQIKNPSEYYATVVSGSPEPSSSDKPFSSTDQERSSFLANVSSWFLYSIAKNIDGGFKFGEATTGLWGQRANKGYGICLDQYYQLPPNCSKQDFIKFISAKPNIIALGDGYTRRWALYERLSNLNEILELLRRNGGSRFYFASLCFQMFPGIHKTENGYVPLPNPEENTTGNHCVCVESYSDQSKHLIFSNSWGKDWGDKGYGYLPYKYVEQYFVEAWIAIGNADQRLSPSWQKSLINQETAENITFETFTTPSLVNKPKTWVVDAYEDGGRIIGWSHFRIYPNAVAELEELYGIPEYDCYKVMGQLLQIIQKRVKPQGAKKLLYYVHVQDLVTEDRMRSMRKLFETAGWKIFNDTRRFVGCYWRVEKILF